MTREEFCEAAFDELQRIERGEASVELVRRYFRRPGRISDQRLLEDRGL